MSEPSSHADRANQARGAAPGPPKQPATSSANAPPPPRITDTPASGRRVSNDPHAVRRVESSDPHAPGSAFGDRDPTPPRQRGRKRPWALITISIVSFLLLLGVSAVAVYLYQTTEAWEDRSTALTSRVQDLANEVATVSEELDATAQALDRTETQLDNARDRITELADEKAQLGDEHAVQQRLVEYQEHVSEISANVLSALDECIDGQTRVIEYLEDPERYDEDDVERVQEEVDDYCAEATRASEELVEELSE